MYLWPGSPRGHTSKPVCYPSTYMKTLESDNDLCRMAPMLQTNIDNRDMSSNCRSQLNLQAGRN